MVASGCLMKQKKKDPSLDNKVKKKKYAKTGPVESDRS